MAGDALKYLPLILDVRGETRTVDYTHGTLDGTPSGPKLRYLPAEEFSDKVIFGVCFSCETPDSDIFPPGSKGMQFYASNLDNVRIPDGCYVDPSCSTRRFKVQEDGHDYYVDPADQPIARLDEAVLYDEAGAVIGPAPKDPPTADEAALAKLESLVAAWPDLDAKARGDVGVALATVADVAAAETAVEKP